jgi:ATP-dependent Clp protease protease subunit
MSSKLPFDLSAGGAGRPAFDPALQRGGAYERRREMTLEALLLDHGIIFLTGQIWDGLADLVIKQLLYLQYENKSRDIHLYINSPGGSLTATLAMYDTMQFIEAPINTYCMGLAASGAAVLLAAGTKGKRYCLPNSKVMIHQPAGYVGGQVSDIEIQAQEILKERERLNEILARHTGQSIQTIAKETDRDRYYHAGEAKSFGLVDEVLSRPPEKK